MDQADSPAAATTSLSQLDRVACVFTASSKTFEDIRNGHCSWWLPFVLLALASYLFFGAVVQKVGILQTVQNQIQINPRAQQQMAQASPEQIERAAKAWAGFTEGMFIAGPALGLLFSVVTSAVFLGTINFVFGGRAGFKEMFAVSYYAQLPAIIKVLMGIAVMWFQPPEVFNIKNFAPTNPAALFLDPGSSNQALYALASQLDVVTIWTLVLLSIGVAAVAGVKRSSGYITVFGWWAVVVLFRVGAAAAFS